MDRIGGRVDHIKRELKLLCQELCTEGQETCFLVADIRRCSWTHLGSVTGENFLKDRDDIGWMFLNYCRDLLPTDSPLWYCCDIKFSNIQEFTNHTKIHHGQALVSQDRASGCTTPPRTDLKDHFKNITKIIQPADVESFDLDSGDSVSSSQLHSQQMEHDEDTLSGSDISPSFDQHTNISGKNRKQEHPSDLAELFQKFSPKPNLSATENIEVVTADSDTDCERTEVAKGEVTAAENISAIKQNPDQMNTAASEFSKTERNTHPLVQIEESSQVTDTGGGTSLKSQCQKKSGSSESLIQRFKLASVSSQRQNGNSFSTKYWKKREKLDFLSKQSAGNTTEKTVKKSYSKRKKKWLESEMFCLDNNKQHRSKQRTLNLDEGMILKCKICGKDFKSKKRFENHCNTHTQESQKFFSNNFQAENIAKPLAVVKKQKTSRTSDTEKDLQMCQNDPTTTVVRRQRNQEMSESNICEVCGKEFETSLKLRRHMAIHTGNLPYTCDTCGRSFNHASNLCRHKHIHSTVKPHKCDICGKAFAKTYLLKKHMGNHQTDKPFKCNSCDKSFSYALSLKIHLRHHTGEKPFRCDICGKVFATKSNLTTHQTTHSQVKPYMCDICGNSFRQNMQLQNHIKTHTGEKPFKCQQCGWAFVQRGNYQAHMRIHTGEKPYLCDICGKGFTSSEQRKRHTMFHTGERRHFCNICGKGFVQSGDLKKHLKIHSKSLGQFSAGSGSTADEAYILSASFVMPLQVEQALSEVQGFSSDNYY